MRMRRVVILGGLVVALALVSGCDIFGTGTEPDPRPPGGDDYTFTKNTEVIDLGEVSVEEKTDSEIIFQTTGTNLNIEEGEVLVSEVPESKLATAPRFLRKVESVSREDGKVTVSTSEAALVDAVEQGSVDFSASFSEKSKAAGGGKWKVTSVAEGVKTKSCDAVELGNVSLHPENSNIEVALKNGSISFCPDTDVSIDIDDRSLEEFSTTASGNLTYDTDLTATASASVDLSNSTEIATFKSYGFAGYVFYTVELTFVAGFEAQAGGSVGIETGIESDGSLKLGGRYKEGEWSTVSSQDMSFNSRPVEWGRNAGATVRGYIRPEITVFIYEVAGPNLFTGPYVELVAEKSEDLVKDRMAKDYKYGAFGGLNGGVGFDIEVIEHEVKDFEKSVFDLRREVAGAGPTNPAPNEPSSPQPADGSETSGTAPTLTWNASDPDNDDLTHDVYFGTSSTPPLAASDLTSESYDPGSLQNETTYYWKIETTDQDGATTEGPVWSFTTPPSGAGDPSEEGLIARYPFKGNAEDASGNGNDGTVKGATLTSDRFGNPESAYSFDGEDDYIETEKGLPDSESITISFWVYMSEINGGRVFMEQEDFANKDLDVGMFNDNGFKWRTKDGDSVFIENDPFSKNTWAHIALVADAKNNLKKVFVDGKKLYEDKNWTGRANIGYHAPIIFGKYHDNNGWFKGRLDDYWIYDRALTESEVHDLYNAGN